MDVVLEATNGRRYVAEIGLREKQSLCIGQVYAEIPGIIATYRWRHAGEDERRAVEHALQVFGWAFVAKRYARSMEHFSYKRRVAP